ncbi:MAG: DUF4340 domain-containing protein [Candidatus Bruticola sp.]
MRSVITMLIVVILLGGFWYFHDIRGSEKSREEQRLSDRVFPQFESKDVKAMVWSDGAADPETVRRFVRQDIGWTIELGDYNVRADGAKLNELAETAANLSRQETIAENPTADSLAQYGLDKPLHRFVVEYAGPDGKVAKTTLLLGNMLIDDSGSYARLETPGGQAPVLAVPGGFITVFMSMLDDLREHNLFAFSPERIRMLRYESCEPSQPGSFTLKVKSNPKAEKEKSSSFFSWGSKESQTGNGSFENEMNEDAAPKDLKWYVSDPQTEGGRDIAADLRLCNTFIWALQDLKVKKFLYHDDTTPFKVKARLTIEIEGRKEPFVYEFAQAVPHENNIIYALRTNPDERLMLECSDLAEVFKLLVGRQSSEFLDRHVASISLNDVQRFEVVVPAKRSGGAYKTVAKRSKSGWSILQPSPSIENEGKKLEIADALLYSLIDLQWEKKLADSNKNTGAKSPKGTEIASYKLYTDSADGAAPAADIHIYEDGQGSYFVRLTDGTEASLAKDPRYDWIKACEKLDPATASKTDVVKAASEQGK